MVIIGLTGSIGMGKSTAARMLRRLGVPVHDADAAVHAQMARGGAAVAPIAAAFPGVVRDGAVDRRALGARVFGNREALRRLEAILHPLVRAERMRFLCRQARRRAPVVVLDIPLLFETGADCEVDAVITVSAPAFLQRLRVLKRPDMTEERLRQILSRQMPDREKRRRADAVVRTGGHVGSTFRQLRNILSRFETWPGRHWPPPGYRRLRPLRVPAHARNRP